MLLWMCLKINSKADGQYFFNFPIVEQKRFVLLLELRAKDTNCDAVRQLCGLRQSHQQE
jgi:hypothetical protein